MIALGLVLLVLCLALGAGIVLSNTDAVSAEAFGVSLSNLSVGGLFLLGAAIGAAAMLGLVLMLAGAARKRAKKRELRGQQESLAEENARLQAKLEQERSVSPYPESSEQSSTDAAAHGKHRA